MCVYVLVHIFTHLWRAQTFMQNLCVYSEAFIKFMKFCNGMSVLPNPWPVHIKWLMNKYCNAGLAHIFHALPYLTFMVNYINPLLTQESANIL